VTRRLGPPRLVVSAIAVALGLSATTAAHGQDATTAMQANAATVIVRVEGAAGPVAQAVVKAGTAESVTDDAGLARLVVSPGTVTIDVTRAAFEPGRTSVTAAAGATTSVTVTLDALPVLDEHVLVTAARYPRRIRGLPLRVEVVE